MNLIQIFQRIASGQEHIIEDFTKAEKVGVNIFLEIWFTWNYSSQPPVFQRIVYSFVLLALYVKKCLKSGMSIESLQVLREPSGRPNTNCFLCHLCNSQDYSDRIEDDDTGEFLPGVEEIPPNYLAEFGEFVKIIMIKEALEMLVYAASGLNLYYL